MENKYAAQKKHLRTHYVRFSLDLRPEVLEEFKAICARRGTTPTTEIKKFIDSYCKQTQEEQIDNEYGKKPEKQER